MSELQTTYLLDAPVAAEEAIRNPNFFNGRVLTARDMQDEQLANRRQHRQLGRTIGAGIVSGLEVRLVSAGGPGASPLLAIGGGLAINREGQAIELPVESVQVALSRRKQPPPPRVKVFDDCVPPQSAPDLVGKGVYLLTIAPQAEYRERAPMVSLNGGGKADVCGDRYAVEGVRFGLLELDLPTLGGVSEDERSELASLLSKSEQNNLTPLERLTARSRLRNLLAYACFGSAALAALRADPFGAATPSAGYGILDALWAGKQLQPCEVPLALLIWTNAGVRVVDMWAVRRQATAPRDPLMTFTPHDPARSGTAAMIAQFHHHVADLVQAHRASGLLGAMRMVDLFRYLPPCGALPIARMGAPGPPIGFVPQQFFQGIAARPPVFIEGALIAGLYDEALAYPPIDVSSGEFCWLYRTRENAQATERAGARPVLYIAHGHLPYRGDARVNLARAGYSNIAGMPIF